MPIRTLEAQLRDAGDFFPPDLPDRLTLYVRDEDEYRIYAVRCPHGKVKARQLDKREYGAERTEGLLVGWGKEAVESLPCACGTWARQCTLRDFVLATPNWMVRV